MVCMTDEEVKFDQFMDLVKNVTRRIPHKQRRIVMQKTRKLCRSEKFKEFKRVVDANFIALIKCECLHAFYVSLSLFVEQAKALQRSRYTRSFTFVLMRLIALLSLPNVKAKIPDIVKGEICVLLDRFLKRNAFRFSKKKKQFVPNFHHLWFTLFLEKHAYAFGRVYADYKVVSEKLNTK